MRSSAWPIRAANSANDCGKKVLLLAVTQQENYRFSSGSQPPQKGGDPLRQQGAASCLKTPLKGGGLALSVPAPRRPRHEGGGRWEVIGSALDSWPRTFRLCLILGVAAAAPCLAALAAILIHHAL
jgi:hypothetical protein